MSAVLPSMSTKRSYSTASGQMKFRLWRRDYSLSPFVRGLRHEILNTASVLENLFISHGWQFSPWLPYLPNVGCVYKKTNIEITLAKCVMCAEKRNKWKSIFRRKKGGSYLFIQWFSRKARIEKIKKKKKKKVEHYVMVLFTLFPVSW